MFAVFPVALLAGAIGVWIISLNGLFGMGGLPLFACAMRFSGSVCTRSFLSTRNAGFRGEVHVGQWRGPRDRVLWGGWVGVASMLQGRSGWGIGCNPRMSFVERLRIEGLVAFSLILVFGGTYVAWLLAWRMFRGVLVPNTPDIHGGLKKRRNPGWRVMGRWNAST